LKDYDKIISTQVTKYVREIDNIEERGLVFLQVPESVYDRSEEFYLKDSVAVSSIQQEYAKELLELSTKSLPTQALTRQATIEGYAISLMNIVKIPPVLAKSLETSIGIYLNDYYQVIDAAHEDHELQFLQLLKAVKHYNLEEEDPLIKALIGFKQALLTKF